MICVYYAQMARRIRASDIYGVAHYTRNQFRGLLQEIGYRLEGQTETQPRVARSFTAHDFLVLLIACELDMNFAIRRNVIAKLLPEIAKELSGPRPVARQPQLLLTITPCTARYADGEISISGGIVVPLAGIFSRVDLHLRSIGAKPQTSQPDLNFGPSLVQARAPTTETTSIVDEHKMVARARR